MIYFFSSMAHIVSELTTITDSASRQALMNQVPSELFSATCIGCGLSLATKVIFYLIPYLRFSIYFTRRVIFKK